MSQFNKIWFYLKVLTLSSLPLVVIGLALNPLGAPPVAAQNSNATVPAKVEEKPAKPVISGKPVRIVIERLNVDVKITDGTFNPATKQWNISDYDAHYATMSPLANDQSGNTFIYGHNNKFVFMPIDHLQTGDIAKVYTDNGYIFSYVFNRKYETSPNDVSVFGPSQTSKLTLQTCSGIWYELRQLSEFHFVSVSR